MALFGNNTSDSFNLRCDEDDSLTDFESWSQGDTVAGLIDETIGLFDNLSRCNSLSRTMSGGESCKLPPLPFEGFFDESLGQTLSSSRTKFPATKNELHLSEADERAFVAELKFDLQAAALTRQMSWDITSSAVQKAESLPQATSCQKPKEEIVPLVLSVPRAGAGPQSAPLCGSEVAFVTCTGPDGSLLSRLWDGQASSNDSVVVVHASGDALKSATGRRTSKTSTGGRTASPVKGTKGKGTSGASLGEEVVQENGDIYTWIHSSQQTRLFVPPPPDPGAAARRETWRLSRSRARARLDAKRHRHRLAGAERKRHYPERQAAATTRKRVGGRFQKENKGCFKSVTEIQRASCL